MTKVRAVPDRVWTLAIILIAFGLRVDRLGDQSLWFDESLSWWVATTDIPGFLLPYGAYTPLYYLLVGGTAFIGTSEYWLRCPSVAFSVLSVVLIERVGRRAGGPRVGRLAALLLAMNPFSVWYAQDARMYALVTFGVLLAMDGFMRGVEGRGWRRLCVGAALAYFTHTIALLLVYVQLVWWLPRVRRQARQFRRWFGAQVLAALPLVPWQIWHLLQPVQGLAAVTWIPTPPVIAPALTLWNFISADIDTWTWATGGLAVLALVVTGLGAARPGRWRGLMLGWLLLPILTAWVLSIRVQIYVDRYFAYSQFPLIILMAAGLVAVRPAIVRVAATGLLMGLMLVNTVRLHGDPVFAKEDWRGATAILNTQVQPGDRIGVQDTETLVGLHYYYRGAEPLQPIDLPRQPDRLDQLSAQTDRLWLVYRSGLESNHRLTKSLPFDVFTQTDAASRTWLATKCAAPLSEYRFTAITVLLCPGQK